VNTEEISLLVVLDKCLDLIQSEGTTLSDCLQAYPEHRERLEPLLTTAILFRSELAPSGPTEAYSSTTKIRLLNQVNARQRKLRQVQTKHQRRLPKLTRPAYVLISVALLIVFLLSGIGVVRASAEALPGDALYGLKRGVEEIQLILSRTIPGDVELLTQFSDERIEEIEELISSERSSDMEIALREYDDLLSRLLEIVEEEQLTEDNQDLLDTIHGGISHHEDVLRRVLEEAPSSAQPGLENAIQRSSHGKDVLEQLQQGQSPSERAPGQEEKETEKPANVPGEQGHGRSEDEPGGSHPRNKTPGPKPKDATAAPENQGNSKPKKDK
jgi:hypothetical protein